MDEKTYDNLKRIVKEAKNKSSLLSFYHRLREIEKNGNFALYVTNGKTVTLSDIRKQTFALLKKAREELDSESDAVIGELDAWNIYNTYYTRDDGLRGVVSNLRISNESNVQVEHT